VFSFARIRYDIFITKSKIYWKIQFTVSNIDESNTIFTRTKFENNNIKYLCRRLGVRRLIWSRIIFHSVPRDIRTKTKLLQNLRVNDDAVHLENHFQLLRVFAHFARSLFTIGIFMFTINARVFGKRSYLFKRDIR